ncbi:MAG TPA: efflux RND transporter periplasmic adaptor subunit, partial [Vicinamibacteria bacterium]|nr:efflux RND transporter periplasmic adaptor subunit [Vicinamibacteria bacterium]
MTQKPSFAFALVAATLTGACGGGGGDAAPRQQRPALRVRVAPVAVQDVVYQIKSLGQIEARDV